MCTESETRDTQRRSQGNLNGETVISFSVPLLSETIEQETQNGSTKKTKYTVYIQIVLSTAGKLLHFLLHIRNSAEVHSFLSRIHFRGNVSQLQSIQFFLQFKKLRPNSPSLQDCYLHVEFGRYLGHKPTWAPMILGTIDLKHGVGRWHHTEIGIILHQRCLIFKAQVWKNSLNERSYRHRAKILRWSVDDHTQSLAVPLCQKLRIKHIQVNPVD